MQAPHYPTINLNIHGIIGSTKRHKKKMTIKKKKIEYLSSVSLTPIILDGKSEKRIFEPSNGGIGIKLNTARTILIATTYDAI